MGKFGLLQTEAFDDNMINFLKAEVMCEINKTAAEDELAEWDLRWGQCSAMTQPHTKPQTFTDLLRENRSGGSSGLTDEQEKIVDAARKLGELWEAEANLQSS
jgi:hypothetical protein